MDYNNTLLLPASLHNDFSKFVQTNRARLATVCQRCTLTVAASRCSRSNFAIGSYREIATGSFFFFSKEKPGSTVASLWCPEWDWWYRDCRPFGHSSFSDRFPLIGFGLNWAEFLCFFVSPSRPPSGLLGQFRSVKLLQSQSESEYLA